MSAPITEAHIDLVRYVLDAEWYGTNVEKKFAQEIADSEARACEQLRADCDNETKWAAHYLADALAAKARAERAEAELAAERARLDWLEDHGWLTGEPCDRAAIDAAMKEGK